MAIDSISKRFSMIDFGSNAAGVGVPIPDGSFDAGDRESFLLLYAFPAAAVASLLLNMMDWCNITVGPGMPLPDGTIDAGDRAHFSWLYGGIALAGGAAAVTRQGRINLRGGFGRHAAGRGKSGFSK